MTRSIKILVQPADVFMGECVMKLSEMDPIRVVEASPQHEITEVEISKRNEPAIKAVKSSNDEEEQLSDVLSEESKPAIDEEVKAGLGRLFEKINGFVGAKASAGPQSVRYTKKYIVLSAYRKQLEEDKDDLGKNLDIAS